MVEQIREMIESVDRFSLSLNAVVGGTLGGIIGLTSTCVIMTIFSLVSTSRIGNFYMGGVFMLFGTILLYRIHRRRGMVSMDLGKKNDGEANDLAEPDDDAVSLLSTEKLTYKGGVGAEIMHLPLCYKDSYILPSSLNPVINEYIKQAEYGMAIAKVLSGLLTLTLEKHNFKHFDDHYKVPIYMLIGSSMSFLIVYCVHDFCQWAKDTAWWLRPQN